MDQNVKYMPEFDRYSKSEQKNYDNKLQKKLAVYTENEEEE